MEDKEFLKKVKDDFFETFDIKKNLEITDSQYLNLILINNLYAPAVGDTMDELKGQVLYFCIQLKNKIYTKVRELFKENT